MVFIDEGACGPLCPEPLGPCDKLSQEALGEADSTPTLCMGVTGNKVLCFLRGSGLRLCITEGASFHTLPRGEGPALGSAPSGPDVGSSCVTWGQLWGTS